MADLPEWERQLDRLTDQLLPRFYEEVMIRVFLAAFRGIVLATPVWENKTRPDGRPLGPTRAGGITRGSWQPSIGGPARGDGVEDRDGRATIDKARRLVSGYRLGPDLWATNNQKHIRVLEFGLYPNPPKIGTGRTAGGFSTQAPQGMVRITMASVRRQVPGIVRAAWADLIRGQFNGPR